MSSQQACADTLCGLQSVIHLPLYESHKLLRGAKFHSEIPHWSQCSDAEYRADPRDRLSGWVLSARLTAGVLQSVTHLPLYERHKLLQSAMVDLEGPHLILCSDG